MSSDRTHAYQQEQASAEQAYERFQLALQKLEAAFHARPAAVVAPAPSDDAHALKTEVAELRHVMQTMQTANREALNAVNAAITLLETIREEAMA